MAATKSKPDPPVRRDGRCSHCGKEKPVPTPATKSLQFLYQNAIDTDPFCSAKCCREFFEISYN